MHTGKCREKPKEVALQNVGPAVATVRIMAIRVNITLKVRVRLRISTVDFAFS